MPCIQPRIHAFQYASREQDEANCTCWALPRPVICIWLASVTNGVIGGVTARTRFTCVASKINCAKADGQWDITRKRSCSAGILSAVATVALLEDMSELEKPFPM